MPKREPLRGEQQAGGAQRMANFNLAHRVGAPVLVEEAEVRHEGAAEREEYAEIESHRVGADGVIHRQRAWNALLRRRDTGRLPVATSVRAKDDPHLTDAQPSRAASAGGHRRRDLAVRVRAETDPRTGGVVPFDRRHTPLSFVHGGRAPARAGADVRAGMGQRLGGEGQRVPPPPTGRAEVARI